MRTNSPTRWRVLAVGVALFAALALTACSDEQDNDSAQTTSDEASINESATLTVTEATGDSSTDVTDIDGSGSATADTATITESAVKAVESAPSGGGDQTFLSDSVSFVVRDSSGVVTNQGILD